MKKVLYISLVSLVLTSCSQREQTDNITKNDTTDTSVIVVNKPAEDNPTPLTVPEIKAGYGRVITDLQQGRLDSLVKPYDCNGERRGTITYYTRKGELQMIRHRYSEYDHHSAVDEYVLNDSALYFVFLNRLSWTFDSNGAAEGATKDDITEQRIYVANNAPIQCLEKKFTIRSKAADNPKPENVTNKTVKCESIQPVLKELDKLLKFRAGNGKCLDK